MLDNILGAGLESVSHLGLGIVYPLLDLVLDGIVVARRLRNCGRPRQTCFINLAVAPAISFLCHALLHCLTQLWHVLFY